MSKPFRAYYFELDPTGVPEIDEILRLVALAGRGLHSTEGWDDPDYANDDGQTYVDRIQEAARAAATAFRLRTEP